MIEYRPPHEFKRYDPDRMSPSEFFQNDHLLSDEKGRRLIMCTVCGRISNCDDFWKYGGPTSLNLGLCRYD